MLAVTVVGFTGKDAEWKQTQYGGFAKFTIAANVYDNNEKNTIWCSIIKNDREGKLAAVIKKSMMLAVTGNIKKINTYTDAAGNIQKSIDILATDITFCDGKKEGYAANQQQQPQQPQYTPPQPQQQQYQPQYTPPPVPQQPAPMPEPQPSTFDLPF